VAIATRHDHGSHNSSDLIQRSLVLCVCFVYRYLVFSTFSLLAIVVSVLLRYTDSDYLFDIFKFSLYQHTMYVIGIQVLMKVIQETRHVDNIRYLRFHWVWKDNKAIRAV